MSYNAHSLFHFYRSKIYKYAYELLDHPIISEQGHDTVKRLCYFELARIFGTYSNYPAALECSKLAYEHCLRSSNQVYLSSNLVHYKDAYVKARASFSELPPLRFAVGDEVEFLHELETGSEWKPGKVVEIYYWEKGFDIIFTAPYRLQLIDDSSSVERPPVYSCVNADIDRYVRKVDRGHPLSG